MQPQCRFGDLSLVPVDIHGNVDCPHVCIGPAVSGSPNVFVNGRPALRLGDNGIHALCCGPNTWIAIQGSMTVFINGRPAHRLGDRDLHCGGLGFMVLGSFDTLVGG